MGYYIVSAIVNGLIRSGLYRSDDYPPIEIKDVTQQFIAEFGEGEGTSITDVSAKIDDWFIYNSWG